MGITEEQRELQENTDNSKSLSTALQELLDNEKLTDAMIKTHPKWMEQLADIKPKSVLAGTLIASALGGNLKATELIQKIAYGDHVTIDTAPGFFDSKDITITIVDPKHKNMNNESESEE